MPLTRLLLILFSLADIKAIFNVMEATRKREARAKKKREKKAKEAEDEEARSEAEEARDLGQESVPGEGEGGKSQRQKKRYGRFRYLYFQLCHLFQ